MSRNFVIRIIAAWLAVMPWLTAFGHEAGLSAVVIRVRPDHLELQLTMAMKDADVLVGLDQDGDGKVAPEEFAASQPQLGRAIQGGCLIKCEGAEVPPGAAVFSPDKSSDVEVQLRFPVTGCSLLELDFPILDSLPAGHRMVVTVVGPDGRTLSEQLAGRDGALAPIAISPGTPAAGKPHAFLDFLRLGIEHIGTGYDHLLFLFGLLLAASTLRSSLLIITSFTIAHSITLGIATLNLMSLRPSITEPLIALSIVYVGVENLLTRGEPKGRWMLTFAFGLIHGFGFASVLRDLGVSAAGGAAVPLFAFNLGVEIGQLAIAAILLPVIWKLRRNETFLRRVVPACYVAIVAAGGFWFWQRVWGG